MRKCRLPPERAFLVCNSRRKHRDSSHEEIKYQEKFSIDSIIIVFIALCVNTISTLSWHCLGQSNDLLQSCDGHELYSIRVNNVPIRLLTLLEG